MIMGYNWSQKIFFTAILIVAEAIGKAHGLAIVSGTVFCDQCKDGQLTVFDYPLNGIKVTMSCPGSDGQFTMWREETTNWMGSYAMRFDGTPNFDGCYTQVSGSGQGSSGCGAVGGSAKYIRLMFNMFDMAMYSVDPLLPQPAQPMSFCSRSATPVPVSPATPPHARSPPFVQHPPLPPSSHSPPKPVQHAPLPPPSHLPPKPVQHPPLPPSSPLPHMPPTPFLQASACPHQRWTMPEYRCYWRVVAPDTKVAAAFGLLAARRYGTDMTLWRSMEGRGDPYRTLLREGTTALLNSYNSIQFPYHPLAVIAHMNWALMGSTRQVLHTALGFMKANSGVGSNATCTFTSCK